jgi:S-adenosylmethionine synthetase
MTPVAEVLRDLIRVTLLGSFPRRNDLRESMNTELGLGRFGALAPLTTAEMVTDGHPDKFCDQVADAILDAALEQDPKARVGIECLAKDDLLVISGEMSTGANLNVEEIARHVWESVVGYGPGDDLRVIANIKLQSPDIAHGDRSDASGVDSGGASDQGVMVGYATDETPEMLPREYVLARYLCRALKTLRGSAETPWLRADGKSQVTLQNGKVKSVVLAAHHDAQVSTREVRKVLRNRVIEPVLETYLTADSRVVINGTGRFTIGGPTADAGVVGRKIVADAYGPRIPVGGGAYSGKDPSKVDRSAAYMARHIAKAVIKNQLARECMVALAYAIGQKQPEMVRVVTCPHAKDAEHWVAQYFQDLRPEAIIEYLGLRSRKGWTYCSTAAFGHYGREGFPWERVVALPMEKATRFV